MQKAMRHMLLGPVIALMWGYSPDAQADERDYFNDSYFNASNLDSDNVADRSVQGLNSCKDHILIWLRANPVTGMELDAIFRGDNAWEPEFRLPEPYEGVGFWLISQLHHLERPVKSAALEQTGVNLNDEQTSNKQEIRRPTLDELKGCVAAIAAIVAQTKN